MSRLAIEKHSAMGPTEALIDQWHTLKAPAALRYVWSWQVRELDAALSSWSKLYCGAILLSDGETA